MTPSSVGVTGLKKKGVTGNLHDVTRKPRGGLILTKWTTRRTVLAAALLTVLLPSTAAAELPGIMVLNVKHEEQAGPGLAAILTDLILQDLHDLKTFRVVGAKDIEQMLDTEQRKQLAGCTDTSCLVEIAGAMGTKYTLDSTVGAVGKSNVLSLSVIDVTRAAVVSKKTAVVRGDKEELLGTVYQLIQDLLEPVPEYKTVVVKAKERDTKASRPWTWISAGTGGALVLTGAILVGVGQAKVGEARDLADSSKTKKVTYTEVIDTENTGRNLNVAGGIILGLGGALAVTASILYFIEPNMAKLPAVAIVPVVDADFRGLTVGGTY